MAVLQKFMFDRVFDLPPMQIPAPGVAESMAPAVEDAPETPPPPTYSEEDLAAAREEAYAQGREAGIKEMSESVELETRNALVAVENALRELMWSQAAIETRSAEDAVRVALTAVRRLFPALANRDPLAEIEGLVGRAMALVQGETVLNIYVNDRLVEPISERIRPMAAAAGFQGRIKMHPLASLAPGDGRVEWEGGGIGRDAAAMEKAVEETIGRALPALATMNGADAAAPAATEPAAPDPAAQPPAP
jgi:flagellar assembly protein FliH